MRFNLGPDLRFALYKEAMLALQGKFGKKVWDGGWNLIRGHGKAILKDQQADDGECATACIEAYGKRK